jgi:acyl-CoA reductase-like NAD-dependent aldehyde dehydrogenase
LARVAREVQAGTIWINDWAVIHDELEEGGFKRSGRGRLRGLAALEDLSRASFGRHRPVGSAMLNDTSVPDWTHPQVPARRAVAPPAALW